jgi:release factor glutamine methyltransferase
MCPSTPSDQHVDAPATSRIDVVLGDVSARFARAGIVDPRVDAELLLAHVLGIGRGEVQAAAIRAAELDTDALESLMRLVERRAAREPLQHLTGAAPFRHLELSVGPGVFVPRPETEMVAQLAIDALRASASPEPVAVDLGTGSGAIALAMATEVPHARVHAAENSVDAFIWAKENFARVNAANARLVFADLAHAFGDLDQTVPRDPEVRLYDPPQALYGGEDGLDVVRVLARVGLRLLHPGGTIIIEHAEVQGAAVREVLTAAGWRSAATHPDLTLRDRATTALRP